MQPLYLVTAVPGAQWGKTVTERTAIADVRVTVDGAVTAVPATPGACPAP